jgi:hypothetical protein
MAAKDTSAPADDPRRTDRYDELDESSVPDPEQERDASAERDPEAA